MKQICNNLDIPIIIVHQAFMDTPTFINSIQQNVVILIDEYEKVYTEKDYSILTVMDGVLDNGFRKVFMLTTNDLYINSNLLQRPGRVRYLKKFSDLSLEHITEIVDDMLINKDFQTVTIEAIAQLETITVDIVKAVISEVNIHNTPPDDFIDFFNVKKMDNKWDVFQLEHGKEPKLAYSGVSIDPLRFEKQRIGRDVHFDSDYIGEIEKVISDNSIVIKRWMPNPNDDENSIPVSFHYQFEKSIAYNKAFVSYKF